VFAEHVLRDPGVEPVGREIIVAADELELITRHDQMQKALLGTDRAIAVRDPIKIGADTKTHPPAMASTAKGFHGWQLLDNRSNTRSHRTPEPSIVLLVPRLNQSSRPFLNRLR
jgi:hypothetical protein